MADSVPPQSLPEVTALVRSRGAAFTPAQHRVAEAMLDDPQHAAFSSVKQIAAKAGVNEATVVRFAQSLGFDGFLSLRAVFRSWLNSRSRTLPDLEQTSQLGHPGENEPGIQTLLRRAANLNHEALLNAVSAISEADWQQAVAKAAAAPRILVGGLRHSFSGAFLVQYLLSWVRDDVHLLNERNGVNLELLRSVTPDDVVIVIATDPYTNQTVEVLNWAKQRGAVVICFTDTDASPLAQNVDFYFTARASRTSVLPSITAISFLAEEFCGAVAMRNPGSATTIGDAQVDILEKFHTHWRR